MANLAKLGNRIAAAAVILGGAASAAQTALYDGTASCQLPMPWIPVSHAFVRFVHPVDAGTRAVIFNRFHGVENRVIGEGTHIRMPYIEKPYIMDIRTRPRSVSTVTGTKGASLSACALVALKRRADLMCFHVSFFSSLPQICKW